MIRSHENKVLADFRQMQQFNCTPPRLDSSAAAWLASMLEFETFRVYTKEDIAQARKVLMKIVEVSQWDPSSTSYVGTRSVLSESRRTSTTPVASSTAPAARGGTGDSLPDSP